MNLFAPPVLACSSLPGVTASFVDKALASANPPFGAWIASLRSAFRLAPACVLRQAWKPAEEPGFAPATVRVGRERQSLLVFSEFTDADIFSRVTGLNQRAWELGDTFEMFLQPEQQESYVELHVTPNNNRLQLRFADRQALARARADGSITECLVPGEVFRSAAVVDNLSGKWFVLASVPAAAVAPGALLAAGTCWRFSFGRYDYTRGRTEPVISSSSPHAEPDFHRSWEWGRLMFPGEA